MCRFIFMLTRDDRTVDNAHEAYEQVRGTALRRVGFKDVGLPWAELRSLARRIRADGRELMLEVVSQTPAAEIASVQAGVELGVDCVLGGRQVDEARRVLGGTGIRYFPFAGPTTGHPTRLAGSLEEIVDDARRLAALPGVHGLDLLAYRFGGDAPELVRRVVAAVDVPVIAAGSIDRPERIDAMRRAGTWAFTIGGALLDGAFGGAALGPQVSTVLGLQGVQA